jgi:hypothetical protein
LHVGTHIWRYGALHNASKQRITAPHPLRTLRTI